MLVQLQIRYRAINVAISQDIVSFQMVLSLEGDELDVLTFVDFEKLTTFLREGQDIKVFFPVTVFDCSISVLRGVTYQILIYKD